VEKLETTIRRHLVRYLAGQMSLDDFTDWLVGATWNIEKRGDAETKQLVYSIELALAEASSGLLTLDELRTEFRTLLNDVNISLLSQPQPQLAPGVSLQRSSTARTITKWLLDSPTTTKIALGLDSTVADTRLVAAL
jgi:hypothetical protein